MNKILMNRLIIVILLLTIFSCKKDSDDVMKPQNPNETELITTVKLVFTDAGNDPQKIVAIYKDLSGNGSSVSLDTIKLESGKTYNTQLFLFDELKSPSDTISIEVEEEGDQHQVFYMLSAGTNILFSYADEDEHGVPVGLLTEFKTTTPTSDKKQTLTIILKHQGGDKPKNGNGNQNIGDTDMEVIFPLIVK